MFKLESYITPLILSRVEKYVKNVRSEDSQVSLWGGDASLTNLDLKLDVLEEEFKLPFRLVSGHIHELQIHVPWTRLQSEPIVLTINTIECVLRLPDGQQRSVSGESGISQDSARKTRRVKTEDTAPPGYIQNLVNKIISNVQVVCNNLILKYVDDDLVLSINVRRASLVSSDLNWEPAFTELSLADLVMRKLLSVSDLTVCLDKRGPMGKIESYEDPLLYRCSLSARISWCYQSLHAKAAYRTLFHIMMDKMDFSITSRQMGLLYRLHQLFLEFVNGNLRHTQREQAQHQEEDDQRDPESNEDPDDALTLGGLLWSVGSSVGSALLPIQWDEDEEEDVQDYEENNPSTVKEQSTSISLNFKEIDVTLKTSKAVKSKGCHGGHRNVLSPFLCLSLQGVYIQLSSLGHEWVNVQGGVGQLVLAPTGDPSQLHSFVLSGCDGENYLKDSLFEPQVSPMAEKNRVEQNYPESKNWEQHLETWNETAMLEKTPALAMDYIYSVEFPSDATSEDIVQLSSNMEHSNLPERALCRLVVGPTIFHVDVDFVQRLNTIRSIVDGFESIGAEDDRNSVPVKLEIPTKEEIDSLENNNPARVYRLTVLHPVVNVHLDNTRLEAGVKCIDATIQTPMYPLRNVKVGSVMHPPSKIILNNSHNSVTVTVLEFWMRILYKELQFKLINIDNIKFNGKTLLYKQFWKNIYQKQGELHVDLDHVDLRLSVDSVQVVQSMMLMLRQQAELAPSNEGLDVGGQVVHLTARQLRGSFTWTSRIHTVTCSVGDISAKFANVVQPFKPKFATVLKGSPPTAEQAIPGWLKLILQYPSGNETQFVPPILFARVGPVDVFLFPGYVPVLHAVLCSSPNRVSGSNAAKCEDSGFKSFDAVSVSEKPDKTSDEFYTELLKSSIVNIRTDRVSLTTSEEFSVAFTSASIEESVARLTALKPGLAILRVGFSRFECFNSNCLVEESSMQQYPVLFPPAVWISGKNTLPLTVNMEKLEAGLVQESTSVIPFSIRCTLSMNSGENKAVAKAIHADISPIQCLLAEVSVSKLVRVIQALIAIRGKLFDNKKTCVEVLRSKPDNSFALLQHSVSSVSECGTPATHSQCADTYKIREVNNFSLWLQCTMPSLAFSVESVAGKRISVAVEDCSLSLDSQPSYSKVSLRVRSLNSVSESLDEKSNWIPNHLQDLVISCNKELTPPSSLFTPDTLCENYTEDCAGDHQSLSTGFFNLVLTRAEVKNVHRKWKVFQGLDSAGEPPGIRFLSEIDIEVFPIDVYLNLDTLRLCTETLLPVWKAMNPVESATKADATSSLMDLNNNRLPMVYLKSKRCRLFLHNPKSSVSNHDLIVAELGSAKLTSQVENPLSRILVDQKVYYAAAENGVLELPGSAVEDRQYQLDLTNINLMTGNWQDLLSVKEKPEKILLRTMSENPAFEWNSRSKTEVKSKNSPMLYPVFQYVNSKINFAPAVVLRKTTGSRIHEHLVAGISLEVNTFTDIKLFAGVRQLSAINLISSQLQTLFLANNAPETCSQTKPDDDQDACPPRDYLVPTEILLTCNSIRLMVYEDESKLLNPLVMFSVSQPHIFSVISPASEKLTLSLYTFQISASDQAGLIAREKFVDESNFSVTILESRAGTADLISGLRPPSFSLTLEGFFGKFLDLRASFGRPVKVSLEPDVLSKLLTCPTKFSGQSEESRGPSPFWCLYNDIRLAVDVSKASMVFTIKESQTISLETQFSSLNFSSEISVKEEICCKSLFDCKRVKVTVAQDDKGHTLIGPVNFKLTPSFATDFFLNPLRGTCIFNTSKFCVHLGPDHLEVLDRVQSVVCQIFPGGETTRNTVREHTTRSAKPTEEGEHFHDDLRLGAFTIEENLSVNSVPLPYRVYYSKNSVTWTYPRPRTLTKMVILPLPLTLAEGGSGNSDSVDCQLQLWSTNRAAWVMYQKFILEEGSVTHVDLPLFNDRRSCEFAATWRIQMFSTGRVREEVPLSLLSALRVDSFFSSTMLPDFTFIVNLDQIQLQLHNHLDPQNAELTGNFFGLKLDASFPKDQEFMSIFLDDVTSEVSVWRDSATQRSFRSVSRGRLGVDITDFSYLSLHHVVKPCDAVVKLQMVDRACDIFSDFGTASVTVGPFVMHTIKQSAKLWDRTTPTTVFVPITQLLIVNETCSSLLVGQTGTDEKIRVDCKTMLMYTWRSQKCGSYLRVATSQHYQDWSESLPLEAGETKVKLGDKVLVCLVERLSTTVKVIKLRGLVTVVNLLSDHLEVKLINSGTENSKVLQESFSRPVSFLTEPGGLELKLKVFGLFTSWSGPICLNNARKSALVRLPYRDKGSNITVWCSVLSETVTENKKLLAVISPMYVVHSNVPRDLVASYQCETMSGQLDLPGLDTVSQLEVHHAPENKFQLGFKQSSSDTSSSPAVSISWGIIDQVRSTRPEDTSFNLTLRQIASLNSSKLNPDPVLADLSDLKVVQQTGDDCQIRFEEVHPMLNTLKIHVEPKLLIVNRTEVDIIYNYNEEFYFLGPNSVLHSPHLASSVSFGLLSHGGKEFLGSQVEIMDHDWTYVSLLPTQDRGLPASGDMIYRVLCDGLVMILNLLSEKRGGIRILTIQPLFVFTNKLDRNLDVFSGVSCRKALSIQNDRESESQDHRWSLEAGAQGQGLFWTPLDKGDSKPEFKVSFAAECCGRSKAMYLSLEADRRRNFVLKLESSTSEPCLLISYRHNAQLHAVIVRDERPQFQLTNLLDFDVEYGETDNPLDSVESGGSTFYTSSYIEEGYPYIGADKQKDLLSFRRKDTLTDNADWSRSVNIGLSQETFLNMPGFGDVKLRVDSSAPLSHVWIEPVSDMEISAKDIRARFESATEQTATEADTFVMVKPPDMSLSAKTLESEEEHADISSSGRIFTVCVKIEEFDFALTDDLCNFSDIQEILRVTVSDTSLNCLPNLQHDGKVQQYQVRLTVGDLQLDNQMYDVGLYHFPVVLGKHENASDTNFLDIQVACDKTPQQVFTKRLELTLSPVCVKVEDTLVYVLREFLTQFTNIGTNNDKEERCGDLPVPVLLNVESCRNLIYLERICINPVNLQMSVHASVKLFLSLEDTVLNLAKFEQEKLWCSGYSLGHTMSRHYLSGALFKAGWVVGSLDVIGNPAAFTRNVSEGIKDFVAMPCEGIFNGPWGFMVGLTLGSSSLVKHVSAGTVTSITNFAKTVSRNLDKLSFDAEHWERNEEARRSKPKGVTEGVLYGLSGIGVSVLGALGGLAHHPIQILVNEGVSPFKLIGGVGKGLVGMVAKPLGGAAEFVALTGQGLLVGTGWSQERRALKMALPTLTLDLVSSNLKYQWKFPLAEKIVCSVDASLYSDQQYSPVTCILTVDSLIIISEDEDAIQHVHGLSTLNLEPSKEDPTLSVLKILTERSLDPGFQTADRVAQFVLDSLQYTGNPTEQMSDNDLALLKPGPHVQEEYLLYINPRHREWFSISLDSLKDNLESGS